MNIVNVRDINILREAIDKCEGNVYLKSIYGDCYNLKSALTLYIAIGALLDNHGDELELFCDRKDDEAILLDMLAAHPEIA